MAWLNAQEAEQAKKQTDKSVIVHLLALCLLVGGRLPGLVGCSRSGAGQEATPRGASVLDRAGNRKKAEATPLSFGLKSSCRCSAVMLFRCK